MSTPRARAIGLVPPVPLDRVASVGNTSLEGAKLAILSFREHRLALRIADRVEYVELSGNDGFTEAFVSALAFPVEAVA